VTDFIAIETGTVVIIDASLIWKKNIWLSQFKQH